MYTVKIPSLNIIYKRRIDQIQQDKHRKVDMVIPRPLPPPVEHAVQTLPTSHEGIEKEENKEWVNKENLETWEDAVGTTENDFSNLNEPSTSAISNGNSNELPSESSQNRYDLRPRKKK